MPDVTPRGRAADQLTAFPKIFLFCFSQLSDDLTVGFLKPAKICVNTAKNSLAQIMGFNKKPKSHFSGFVPPPSPLKSSWDQLSPAGLHRKVVEVKKNVGEVK